MGKCFLNKRDKFFRLELFGRNINSDRKMVTFFEPFLRLTARLGNDPFAEVDNQAGFFGGLDKVSGILQFSIRAGNSQKRFNSRYELIGGAVLRLIMKDKPFFSIASLNSISIRSFFASFSPIWAE